MDFHPKKFPPQKESPLLKSGAGFTFIETLVALSVLMILLGLILATYRRGNEDSILNREITLLMSRFRLAQEQTAGGTVGRYCEQPYYGISCQTDSNCPGGYACRSADAPKGGYVMAFNCDPKPESGAQWGWGFDYPKIGDVSKANTTPYFLFGERVSCDSNCYSGNDNNWVYGLADEKTSLFSRIVGDTVVSTFQLDNRAIFKDLQIISSNQEKYWCNSALPWRVVPVPSDYPLIATVRFKPSDGRQIEITNNVSIKTPSGYDWTKVEVMFGLRSRNTDCQVVAFSREGVVSKYLDTNCSFAN
ncbi:type II secretion system protein [Candidatus Parcubacteria bacterium]|jgi:type II secretory pathway pseudopilin PulG|nr:MAG: type II secretion system protein [Candidatus Parcubacteria bacterium]